MSSFLFQFHTSALLTFFFLQYGVSVNVGQLRCHGEVMWLNQKDELLGRAWKKGQGPNVLCFGKGH